MSGSGPPQRWVPPGGYQPEPGWYPGPAGSGVLLWWDGYCWADPARPAVPGQPPAAAGRLAVWLASPAGTLLLAAVAAVTATGWVSAAAVLVATAASGHAVAAAAGALNAVGLALPAADGVIGIATLQRDRSGLDVGRGPGRTAGTPQRRPAASSSPPQPG